MPDTNLTATRRRALHVLFERFVQSDLSERGPAGEDKYADSAGLSKRFAEAIGIHQSLLSHLRRDRPISNKVAEQIETRLREHLNWSDVVPGWMSEERETDTLTDAERHVERLAVEAYRALNAADKRQFLKHLQRVIAARTFNT